MKITLKYILMTMITMIICLLCLILPSELSRWKDELTIGTVNLDQIEEINIESSRQLTMLEKLELLMDYYSYNTNTISLKKGKNLTENDIPEVCQREIDRLKDLGFLEDISYDPEADNMKAYPYFYVSSEDPSKSMVVWSAVISSDLRSISIEIDDESGKILGMINKSAYYSKDNVDMINYDIKTYISLLGDYYGFTIDSYEELEQPLLNKYMSVYRAVPVSVTYREEDELLPCYLYISSNEFRFSAITDSNIPISNER